MKIADSNILMSSSRYYAERTEISESFKMWIGDQEPRTNEAKDNTPHGVAKGFYRNHKALVDTLELSGLSKQTAPVKTADNKKDVKEVDNKDPFELSPDAKLKIQVIERFMEILTGKKITVETIDEKFKCNEDSCPRPVEGEAHVVKPEEAAQANTQQAPQRAGWGLEYDYHEVHYESEQTTFSAEGIVRTADGKEISFNVDLSMSREVLEKFDVSVRAGDAVKKVDPLVINFEGTAAQLTQTKFDFDLNVDGVLEQVAFTGPSSAMLVLDKNNDGVVNDGSELFGPATGDGFSELAQYDTDSNGWIDENDPVFYQLRLWIKDGQGQNFLVTLAEKDVGAIFLGSQSTDFSIKDGANQLQGQVVQTGIYLAESGSVGTVQQIDLAA